MRRISSRMMLFYKRFFPVILFGFPLFMVAFPFIRAGVIPSPSFFMGVFMIPGLIMAGVLLVLFFIIRRTALNIVDEVFDDGQSLVVRNKGQEERILLADIVNVSYG